MPEGLRAQLLNAIKADYVHQEWQIRNALGRWVSELEPVLIWQDMRFKGLGTGARDEDGCIIVTIEAVNTSFQAKYAINSRNDLGDDDD